MKQASLDAIVSAIVEEQIDANQIVAPAWVTHEIVSRYPEPECDGSDFYLLCAYEHTYNTVTKIVRRYKGDDDGQGHLSGFDPSFPKVHKAYVITRNGEQLTVPVMLMSIEEAEAKAQEIEAMGRGCFEHASQLRAFASERLSREAQ